MQNYIMTSSGVKVYKNWQDNIIIDANNPTIIAQSAKTYYRGLAKGLSRLGSENSEDALTWNIFRTLQDIPASLWLHTITRSVITDEQIQLHFWKSYSSSPTYPYPEGKSEVDLAIESTTFLIFVEAKFGSAISKKTSHNSKRNQVIRNIDVGSYYASQSKKDFYFFLLTPQTHITDLVLRYQDIKALKQSLPHRDDTIDYKALASRIFHIHWETIIDLLRDKTFRQRAGNTFDDLLAWLDGKI